MSIYSVSGRKTALLPIAEGWAGRVKWGLLELIWINLQRCSSSLLQDQYFTAITFSKYIHVISAVSTCSLTKTNLLQHVKIPINWSYSVAKQLSWWWKIPNLMTFRKLRKVTFFIEIHQSSTGIQAIAFALPKATPKHYSQLTKVSLTKLQRTITETILSYKVAFLIPWGNMVICFGLSFFLPLLDVGNWWY